MEETSCAGYLFRFGGKAFNAHFVPQEEAHSHPHTKELAPPVERSSSTPTHLEVDSSSEASSGRSRRSFIGLSDKELLKCAFSHPQAEGATESPVLDGEHFWVLLKETTLL